MMQSNVIGFPFNLNKRCTGLICGTIPQSSFIDIDAQSSASIFAYEYFIQLKTADQLKTKTLKLLADINNGTVRDSVYARIGNAQVAIDAIDTSGTYSLRITNNESQAVDYCIDRSKI